VKLQRKINLAKGKKINRTRIKIDIKNKNNFSFEGQNWKEK
jgi:hypothetical protein